MQEIIACDVNGNSITSLVQWDSNVYVYLSDTGIDKAYRVHFFNNAMDEALVVDSTYTSGILKVKIPNDLLIQPYIITGYVDVTKDDESKCLYGFKINIRKKPKPSNLVYVESNDYVSIEKIREECRQFAESASESANNAKQSELNAESSAVKSADSEMNAKSSEQAAAKYADNAKQSEENAKESENNSLVNAEKATQKASEAEDSAQKAGVSEQNAADSALKAKQSADDALESEINAEQFADDAKKSANESEDFSLWSKSYAIGEGGKRENEEVDNAKYYYSKSKENSDIATNAAQNAEESKNTAGEYKDAAADSASIASDCLDGAEKSAQDAAESAKKAEQIAESIQNLSRWTNTIIDDVTAVSYFIGIENGVVYFSDEFE